MGVDCAELNEDTEGGVVSGAVVLIVTLVASASLLGPTLPVSSLTELAAKRRTRVPSVVHTTVTVIVVPDELDGVKDVHAAVPDALLKSLEATPLTFSENVKVYDNVRDDDGEDGGVHVAVGAAVSTL